MKIISSTSNETLKSAAKLLSKKHRDQSGMFLVEGKRAVDDILAFCPGLVETVFVSDPDSNFGDYLLTNEAMAKLSETENPQGVIAVIKKPVPQAAGKHALFLDRVRDPGNVGTLIRTAVAAGFYDIYLHDTADAYSGKVVRSTMSAIAKANIFETADIGTLRGLIGRGYTAVCADMDGVNSYDYRAQTDRICLVIGNEANGVSDEVKALCGVILALPMSTDIESLNAAVCGGVMMYNLKFLK